jgi:hypothetical protein
MGSPMNELAEYEDIMNRFRGAPGVPLDPKTPPLVSLEDGGLGL